MQKLDKKFLTLTWVVWGVCWLYSAPLSSKADSIFHHAKDPAPLRSQTVALLAAGLDFVGPPWTGNLLLAVGLRTGRHFHALGFQRSYVEKNRHFPGYIFSVSQRMYQFHETGFLYLRGYNLRRASIMAGMGVSYLQGWDYRFGRRSLRVVSVPLHLWISVASAKPRLGIHFGASVNSRLFYWSAGLSLVAGNHSAKENGLP